MRQITCLLLLTFLTACSSTPPKQTHHEKLGVICHWGKTQFNLCQFDSREAMIEGLIDEMTLDEKLGQMTQSVWHNGVSPEIVRDLGISSVIHTEGPVPGETPEQWMDKFGEFQSAAMQSRLGIPLLIGVDAVHGQNTFEGAVIFPHNIGMAATRNLELIERAAAITAKEVAGTGFNWTFSPCIAMPQHEHWGRVYEGFTEDRDLTTAATIASIRGHQAGDLALPETVAATAKHFIGDGATEGGVEGGNAIMSDEEMRERYLPPYAAAVEQGVAAIMVGFNSYNGTNMHQHKEMVADLLKGEMGFEGVVLTDWDGGQRYGPAHTVINAGVDLAMQPGNHKQFLNDLRSSVEDGTVSMERIDDAVRRILKLKFDLGLFSNPFGKRELASSVGSTEHRAVARQAVRESLVLLKSENHALPLKKDDKIIVVGEHADSTGLQSGGWSIHWQGQTESYAGATSIVDAISKLSDQVEYTKTGCYDGMPADNAIVVVGEQPYAEFKGDSDELWLSDEHKKLITDCRRYADKVIVILISGRVLVIKPELELSDAFIAAWLPGSEGDGVADFLFAVDDFKPVGKSPYSWPRKVEDLPLAPDAEHALFPFGYGLDEF